jgi:cytochrome c553
MSSLYFEKSIVDYQKGERHDRRMSLIAQNLTMEQIKDLAAWYSSFEITVKLPEL